ncbi:hypothetical protein CERZMDRAFT_98105 [Cercospora zeae-maydis SCOH1-5]|uniref:Uncharacterized protein n=1 Tax=Cercospora zeae-maydis SCOH1-5 TaxID=717836 RepID=A0A6A6FE55_9PEZI|nr:hypothetical protein CERZMDRAFT_98105 [Cercospora zeae-maydis SCOH1-5]
MDFLVKCARAILHDVAEQSLLETPPQPAPPSLSDQESGLASLALMKAEAPYRIPANLSWDRIVSLLAAKRDAVQDHIWSLREDPSYFSYVMRDSREHRQELIADTRGLAHPESRFSREEILWGRILRDEIGLAYIWLEQWTELHRQAPRLLHRTPEWTEPATNQNKNAPQAKDGSSEQQVNAICKPLSEIYFDLEFRTGSASKDKVISGTQTHQLKSKPKTRGLSASKPEPEENIIGNLVEENPQDPQPSKSTLARSKSSEPYSTGPHQDLYTSSPLAAAAVAAGGNPTTNPSPPPPLYPKDTSCGTDTRHMRWGRPRTRSWSWVQHKIAEGLNA